jgi:hypothetical protein
MDGIQGNPNYRNFGTLPERLIEMATKRDL